MNTELELKMNEWLSNECGTLHPLDNRRYYEFVYTSLVVNEKVVSMGKVLKAADVEKLLRKVGF